METKERHISVSSEIKFYLFIGDIICITMHLFRFVHIDHNTKECIRQPNDGSSIKIG